MEGFAPAPPPPLPLNISAISQLTITKFGTLEEFDMLFSKMKKKCKSVVWPSYDVTTKPIANFGPPRNQSKYISIDRVWWELFKNAIFIEFKQLNQKLWACKWNFDRFSIIASQIWSNKVAAFENFSKIFQNSYSPLNFRRTCENWCCHYVLLQSYEGEFPWGRNSALSPPPPPPLWNRVNPIMSGLFKRSPGSGGAQRAGCQKSRLPPTDWHELCVSHYSHKSMPHAKFEFGSFSIFGDMTSQNFSLKKGTSHGIRIFTTVKWV